MSERIKIGERIVQLRESKGLSQKDLAEMIEMKPNNLSRIETGKFDIKLDTLDKIASALGMRIDFVENNSDGLNAYVNVNDVKK